MSVADELRKLADLKKEGLLTEEEFEAQKARLLAGDLPEVALVNGEPEQNKPTENQESDGFVTIPWKIIVPVALLAVVVWLVMAGDTPEARQAQKEREAIEHCWNEQKRKSLEPAAARFMAAVCERMESDYFEKHRRHP